MTTKELIEANEKQLKLLDTIDLLERLIRSEQSNIKTFYRQFPALKQRAKEKIIKQEVAIFKLKSKYNSNLKNLQL